MSKVSSSGWSYRSPFYCPMQLFSWLSFASYCLIWLIKRCSGRRGGGRQTISLRSIVRWVVRRRRPDKNKQLSKILPFLCPQLVARAKPRLVLVTKRSGLICCSDGQARTSWTCSMVSCKQKPDSLHSWGQAGSPLLWNLMFGGNMVFSLDANRLNDLAGAN